MWYSEILGVLEERSAALRMEMEAHAKRLFEEDGIEAVPLFSTAFGERSGMRQPTREESALAETFVEASGWSLSADVEAMADDTFRMVANGVFRSFAEGVAKGWERAEVDRQWEIWERLGGYGDNEKDELRRGDDGVVQVVE